MSTPFKDYRKQEEITLPVSGATVKIYDGFTTDDIQEIQQQGDKMNVKEIVRMLIVSWDFEDEGKAVPVTNENIGKLHMRDFHAINQSVNLDDFLEESQNASQIGSY